MSAQSLELQYLPKPDRQLYPHCAAHECQRTPRSFSRFCTLHARNFHRTRDPNGRAVRRSEIKPYVELAEEFLRRSETHPAVLAAEELLRANLRDAALPGAIRKQMQRLCVDGASPRAMLINFLAVYGLDHFRPHTVTSDACRDFNLGNRVLRTTALPSTTSPAGKRQPVRLPGRVAQTYGEYLRVRLGVLAGQFWRHVEAELESSERNARAVADALRCSPFG